MVLEFVGKQQQRTSPALVGVLVWCQQTSYKYIQSAPDTHLNVLYTTFLPFCLSTFWFRQAIQTSILLPLGSLFRSATFLTQHTQAPVLRSELPESLSPSLATPGNHLHYISHLARAFLSLIS